MTNPMRIAFWLLAGVLLAATVSCVHQSASIDPRRDEAAAPEEIRLGQTPDTRLVVWNVRGRASLRALAIVPAAPKAALVLFAGGDGGLGLQDNGALTGLQDNFLVRSASLFTARDMLVVLIDRPSDVDASRANGYRHGDDQARDAALVTRYLRRNWRVPVVYVGTSRGTISAVKAATLPAPDGPDGLILTSTVLRQNKHGAASVFAANPAAVTVPTLIMHNTKDGCHLCPVSGVEGLRRALGSVRSEVRLVTSDGGGGDPCQAASPHGYLGIEPDVVAVLVDWVSDPRRGPVLPAR